MAVDEDGGLVSVRLADVGIPTEHGGWSFTLEPALLGLIVAPSVAGALLAAAGLVAFLLRTPLKLVGVDRLRHRSLDRTRLAGRLVVAEAVVLAGLVATGAALARGPFWIPLAVAAPLVAVQLRYDVRSRGRRLAPELAGTIGIGSIAASIVLAAGGDGEVAAGAWLVVSARAVASVLFVRVQLLRAKSRPHRAWSSDAAQLAAVAGVGAGLAAGIVPAVGVAAIGLLAATHVALVRVRPPRTAVLGAQQVVLGLTVVTVAGLAFLAP